MSIKERISEKAKTDGFDFIGFTDAEPFFKEGKWLESWLERGYHGQMSYMEKTPSRRFSPAEVVPGAQGVVILGMSYHDRAVEHSRPLLSERGRIARYARGRDYHKSIEKKLKSLSQFICEIAGENSRARYYVDTGPILERAAAQRAGLGFIGKNTMLINPRFGSWVFLGAVVTTLQFETESPPSLPDCGTCQLCIDACPTNAIVAPFKLDARRCISYLTIEHKGDIPPDLRGSMGDWVFGCDICQEVCPFNRKAETASEGLEDKQSGEGLLLSGLIELQTDEAFRSQYRAQPILRAKREGMLRNAAVAAGNSRDSIHIEWLGRVLNGQSSQVRRHAAWALGKISGRQARRLLAERLQIEEDTSVISEIQNALKGEETYANSERTSGWGHSA